MLRIGEFARKNNVTVRALHHYEEIGLLDPAKIDKFTGYRYYEEYQTKDIRIINILKELGFSLSEISELMHIEVGKDHLILMLNEKYTQARIDLDKAQSRSLGIERLMNSVKAIPGDKKVKIKEISEMNINDMTSSMSPEVVFMENYERILRKAKEVKGNITTMVIDIDEFKSINDSHGYKVGDAVLDAIQRRIIEELPGGSGLLWGKTSVLERKGGDEFIVRVDIRNEDGIELANKICRAIGENNFNYLGIKKPVTLSIGVANMDSNPKNAAEFTHLAESAMYLAKHNGRNRVEVYTGDIKEKLGAAPEY